MDALSNKEKGLEPKKLDKGPHFGKRHIQFTMLFLYLIIGIGMRTNLSVAIVAMTDNSTSSNPEIPAYNWNNTNVVLSSFFWGYMSLQVVAGQIAKIYGIRWLLFGALLFDSTSCLLTPFMAATFGSYGVMVCRVIQGMAQGFFFPCSHNMLGKWAPLDERSRMTTFVHSGSIVGTIFSMALTGLIAASWMGWPASFYIFGLMGYTWMFIWWFVGYNCPGDHSSITAEEKKYIERSIKVTGNDKVPRTPWKHILTSVPVWVFIVSMFGENFGSNILVVEIPTYLSKVMGFSMTSNGLLSAAPYVMAFIIALISGVVSDYIINHGYVSLHNARRIFNCIGSLTPSATLLFLGFLPKEATAQCVCMLILAVGSTASLLIGSMINPVDISPNFSSVIMGLGNGSGTLMSILAPLLVHFYVNDQTDQTQWRGIFIACALVYTATNFVYIFFASTDVQWWDKEDDIRHEQQTSKTKKSQSITNNFNKS